MNRAVDSKQSRVVVHTFAEGMFAKLAKDLVIEWPAASGNVIVDEEGARAEVSFQIDRVRVLGVRKDDAVDEGALSQSDRDDIVKKLKASLGAREGDRIVVTAHVEKNSDRATIDIAIPCGKISLKRTFTIDHETSRVRGEVEVSLSGLGIAPVKGPLGAFRLSDHVRVIFDVTFDA